MIEAGPTVSRSRRPTYTERVPSAKNSGSASFRSDGFLKGLAAVLTELLHAQGDVIVSLRREHTAKLDQIITMLTGLIEHPDGPAGE